MEIRRLRPCANDIEIYKKLRLNSLLDSPMFFGTKFEEALARKPEDWKTQVLSAAEGRTRNTIIAIIDNKAVGLASIYRVEETSTGELVQLWVESAYRQYGIGRKILEALVDWAHGSGMTAIRSMVKKNNIVALKFLYTNSFKDALQSGTNGSYAEEIKVLERRL